MKPHQRQYEVEGKSVDIETFRNKIINLIDDNPWFPMTLREEKDNLQVRDIEAYNTVWEGICRKTVDGALPQLLRVFTQSDDVVRFEPKAPGDEEKAKQATEYEAAAAEWWAKAPETVGTSLNPRARELVGQGGDSLYCCWTCKRCASNATACAEAGCLTSSTALRSKHLGCIIANNSADCFKVAI